MVLWILGIFRNVSEKNILYLSTDDYPPPQLYFITVYSRLFRHIATKIISKSVKYSRCHYCNCWWLLFRNVHTHWQHTECILHWYEAFSKKKTKFTRFIRLCFVIYDQKNVWHIKMDRFQDNTQTLLHRF